MQNQFYFFISLLLLNNLSCSKNEIQNITDITHNVEPDIYVVGNTVNPDGEGTLATYWKNDTMKILKSNYPWGYSYSAGILNSDLYISGSDERNPICWINGKVTLLDKRLNNGLATLINGNDVYIAGYGSYIKNGSFYKLPTKDNIIGDRIFSIVVSGSDLYLCGEGSKNGVETAIYWKNNEAIVLTDGKVAAQLQSIYVKGQDVYVAGYEKNTQGFSVATYWKNGVSIPLSNGKSNASLHSIFVDGNDVYTAGGEWDEINRYCEAVYWKNGKRISLSQSNGFDIITKIEVYNKVVYACGQLNNKPVLWKNGVAKELHENGLAFSFLIVKDGKAVNSQ